MLPRTLVFALALVSLAATAALARAPEGETRKTLRKAMEVPGLAVASERVVFDARGRKDLVVFAHNAKDDVVESLKASYHDGVPLAGGVEVIGYAHLVATDSWTFTLALADKHYVIEVDDDGLGSRLALWGTTFETKARKGPAVVPPGRKTRDSLGKTIRS